MPQISPINWMMVLFSFYLAMTMIKSILPFYTTNTTKKFTVKSTKKKMLW